MKRRAVSIGVGLALLVLAVPASAWEKGISCFVAALDGSVVYVSYPTHDISTGQTTVHGYNFEKFVVAPGEHAACHYVGSASSTMQEDAAYYVRREFPDRPMQWVHVDGDIVGKAVFLRGAKPVAAPKVADAPTKKPPSSGGGALVVGKAKSSVVPGWDEQVREQLRKEADARAKLAASSPANDAKVQAATAEFFRKLKARGSAQ